MRRFFATDLSRVGAGGGTGNEEITVHLVPLPELRGWLSKRESEGCAVDFKIQAALWAASLD